ncbi:MAG: hypothetical protein QOF17_122 [Solirubrobacteraceae bacterium]|nr:hypothetical protein [Solirubrobacteraceae bacterium]
MAADPLEQLAGVYTRFAAREACGRSPLYEELARGVAADREILGVLAELPEPKQQPNLLLAAVRHVCGTPAGWEQCRAWLNERRDEVLGMVLARRTQTNEPARCATLVPLLATLPPPLALLEVGAAAGLCLLPDRYAYDYDGHLVPPSRPVAATTPTFTCRASAFTPLPARGLDIAWRAGLELEPVDVRDPEQTAWLEALVWPGEGDRLELLRAAIDVARADPPPLTRGDLRHDLPALAAQAPREATLVVFHTAVLAYLPDPAERAGFARTVGALDAVWVANEAAGLVDGAERPAHPWPSGFDAFLLTCDRQPVAWTDPHGTRIDWLSTAERPAPTGSRRRP